VVQGSLTWLARRGIRPLAALVLLYTAQLTFHPIPASAGELVAKWCPLVIFPLAAVVCGLNACARRRERAAWMLIGLGLLLWGFGIAYFTIFQWDLTVVPTPSPADAFWLAVYLPWYAGLIMLFRARMGKIDWRLAMDGVIGALGMAAIAAAVVFDAVLHSAEGSPVAVLTNLTYPVCDMLLLSLVVGVIVVGGRRIAATFGWIGAGLCLFAVADCIYLYQSATGSYTSGTPLEAGWAVSAVLIAAAASRPVPSALRGAHERPPTIAAPIGFGLAGLVLLIMDHFDRTNGLALILASLSVLAVLARLAVTFRDYVKMLSASQHEAETDALTGLGNRRALLTDLERELADPEHARATMLILFDLNGFKHYNDTYGHPAGDALLSRLGMRLHNSVAGGGSAHRMGGDEFCVISPLDRPGAGADLISRTTAALAERGEGFTIDCSYGAVVLPEEGATIEEALGVADRRMYLDKRSGRVSAGRQATDALVQALAERHPELEGHLEGVTQLAVAVGRELGLDRSDVEHIRLAAQLHDIGKVAIPDEILNKPDALDEAEWAFMKRHTLIGERILLEAPALAPVAQLVRSSHERADGGGYPDGLAGDEIPLASRIVAVADSFDAMTSNRPYRGAMAVDAAIEELRACSGSQFDEHVVETFVTVLAKQAPRAPISGADGPAPGSLALSGAA
jgi:two-component system cell cycle response regulator